MKFSVVIPLYNKEAYISETLQSLADQTKLPQELVLVDDKSTDNSLNVAKAFLSKEPAFNNVDVQIVELHENKGPGYARNVGFSKTSCDVVSYMDADDMYDERLIETANDLMENRGVDFLVVGIQEFPSLVSYPKMEEIQHNLESLTSEAYHMVQPLKTVTCPNFIMGRGANVFVKRKWLASTKYLEDVSLNEGIDYWYRVVRLVEREQNTKIALLASPLIKVREVPESLSRQKYSHWSQIQTPPTLWRYRDSKDVYDKLLMGVICNRWLRHAVKGLDSRKQKLLFMWNYKRLYLKRPYFFYLRKTQSK